MAAALLQLREVFASIRRLFGRERATSCGRRDPKGSAVQFVVMLN
jgi:hypothetical protein